MKSTLLSLFFLLSVIIVFGQQTPHPKHKASGFLKKSSLTDRLIPARMKDNSKIPNSFYNLIAEQTKQKPASNSVIKQKLDSIYQYFIDLPELRRKNHFRYNERGQEILDIYTSWDDILQAYVNVFKSESDYDAKGNLISSLFYIGDMQNWLPSTKSELVYNSENKLITTISYYWDDFLLDWLPSSRSDLNYNMNGYVSSAIFSQRNVTLNTWEQAFKAELEYDSHFNNTVTTFYFWDNQWLPEGREESTYNSMNQELSYVSLIWDETAADWINETRWLYEYNSNYFLTKVSSFTWDPGNNIWVPSDRTDYSYDMNDNMWQSISYYWDDATQKLEILFKEECQYTNQYSFDDLVLPFNMGDDPEIYCHHMLNRIQEFSYNSGNWHNDVNNDYYYSGINITSVSQQNEIISNIIPNPAQDHILIEIPELLNQAEFRLYDVNGSLLHSQNICTKDKISTHQFAPGIYLYKLISDQNSIGSGKLIIE